MVSRIGILSITQLFSHHRLSARGNIGRLVQLSCQVEKKPACLAQPAPKLSPGRDKLPHPRREVLPAHTVSYVCGDPDDSDKLNANRTWCRGKFVRSTPDILLCLPIAKIARPVIIRQVTTFATSLLVRRQLFSFMRNSLYIPAVRV